MPTDMDCVYTNGILTNATTSMCANVNATFLPKAKLGICISGKSLEKHAV